MPRHIETGELQRIALTPLSGPRCGHRRRACKLPVVSWEKHRAWHAAGGGTKQFDLAKYDRLMEVKE